MKIRFRNVLLTTVLMVCTMIAVCTMVYADSGFVGMEDGATCTVGKPFTITYVAGYYSSSGKLYATIEIKSPDNKVHSEEFPYQNMYDKVEYTFTPDQVGIYIIRGYCSLEWRNYISRHPVERYVLQKDRNTSIQEAVLNVVCSTHQYGEWTVTKEATTAVEGEEKRICSVCGKEETRSIAKLKSSDSGKKETTGKETTGKETAGKETAEQKAESKESVTIAKAPSSVKAKAKKTKVTVSWKKIKKTKSTKKLLSQIKKVEIQYDTDRSFANAVTRKIGKDKTKIVLKLQRKKTYYIRARYRGSDGVSRWSAVRRVQVK